MKKWLSLLLALAMVMAVCSNAMALNYKATLGNEASFETMTEVRANEGAVMTELMGKGEYIAHPVLEDYPGDTTYVYRSPDMYGLNAAVRINTCFLVYTGDSFENKDAAYAYLNELGLIDIVNAARGSIVLVTPTVAGEGFGAADKANYYSLQTALFSIGVSTTVDDVKLTYADAYYYGSYGYTYAIGIGDGATFLNDYVAGTVDFISRIAGMLLVGGTMERIREVSTFVPVYLVNAEESVIAKYKAANETDALHADGDRVTYYNQTYPCRKVLTKTVESVDLPSLVSEAYYDLFTTVQRGEELTPSLYSAATEYQGYSGDCAPYSLSPRSTVFDGKTRDGIYLYEHVEDRFADVKTEAGEYLQTWYEYLPEEVVNGTAKEGTIPLILACHGGGDDPRQFVEGQGFLDLAGAERIAIVAPEKGNLHVNDTEGDDFMSKVLPRLVHYMLETYPALDASRVYVTGFSMGSLATIRAMYGEPTLFAAAFPQSGIRGCEPTETDITNWNNAKLPVLLSTSEYNMSKAVTLNESFYSLISKWMVLEGMEALPETPDYETYSISGFKADVIDEYTVNDDYGVHIWMKNDENGIPMVGACYIEGIVHCLYPQHATIIWNFFKHYSRNLETGEIIYNPYVR